MAYNINSVCICDVYKSKFTYDKNAFCHAWHNFCTDCQAAGVPINVAKKLMGHSDISVTAKIYTHMVDEVFEQNNKGLLNSQKTNSEQHKFCTTPTSALKSLLGTISHDIFLYIMSSA